MDDVKKKHILLSLESELSTKVEAILNDCDVELYTDELAKDKYDFVFDSNPSYEVENEETVLIISNDASNCLHSVLSPELLDNDVVQVALKRFVGEDSTIHLETEAASEAYKTFKITDPFSIGHYLDIVSSTTYKESGEFKDISNSFVNIANYYIQDVKALPIDVDMIVSKEMSVLQFHSAITDSMDCQVPESILRGISANLVDVYFIEKTRELVISLTWINGSTSKAFLKHHLNGFRKSTANNKIYENFEKLLAMSKENVEYTPSKEKGESESSFASIKKIIDFIKGQKDSNPDFYEFSEALSQYPNKEVVSGLAQEDIDFIQKVVGTPEVYNSVNSTVKGKREDLAAGDDIAQRIAGALEEMESFEAIGLFSDEDEAFKKISGVTDNQSEDSHLVKEFASDFEALTKVSGGEKQEDENQLVKGSKEDLKEETTVISGSREEVDDKWKVKRSEIAEKVREEVQKLVSIGDSDQEEIEQRVKSIVKDELSLDDKTAEVFNESILNSASSTSLGENLGSASGEEIFLKLENDRLKGQVSKKMDQILRMKRIIDSMKADFIAKKEAEMALKEKIKESGDASIEGRYKAAEIQIAALLKEVSINETRIEQLVKGHEHTLKNKEHRMQLLEEKISDLKEKSLEASESPESKAKLAELETENKNLSNQLKITNERFETISKKYDKEVTNAPTQFQGNDSGLQTLLDKEKDKNIALQQQINEMKKTILTTEKAEETNQEVSPSEHESNLKVKELEIQLKASGLETKKYEQKIKFMTSQMNELEKKLKKLAAKAGKSNGGGKAGADLKTKRLEKNLEKINQLNDKVQADLTERKKDLHKAKQENTIMSNKVADLERKLAKYEKKAA